MIPRLSFLLLLSFVVLIAGSVIRNDVDEVESNKGNVGVIEGDIMLSDAQREMISAAGKRVKRQITKIWKKWPNGKVYYYFEPSFTDLKKQLMATAMTYISSQTCITFEQSTTASNRLKFLNDGGCASYVGMLGGEQALWFGDGCAIFGTAVHEIMHSLGIFHTHSRSDRDDYLAVSLTNVPEEMLVNLDKETTATTYNAVPFEYGSTMLYRYNTWTDGTLVPKQQQFEKTMGLRRVSFYDMAAINAHYQCRCSNNLSCKNGGYTNPSNCSECVCPTGFAGQLCDGPPTNSIKLTAQNYWQGYWVTCGYNQVLLTTNFYMAYIIINAPADKTIEVRVVEMTNFTCSYGCNYNGVELKVMGDPRVTNPIFCCKDDPNVLNTIYSSKQNPLPIVLHQRYGNSKVAIHYRYVDTPLSSNPKTTNGYDNYQYYA
uniref:Zinc metalloproteinase n=1 Tax=Caenorhabditis tropicalis TaxID=1561998 RepID=A0A1I7TX13_9PELO